VPFQSHQGSEDNRIVYSCDGEVWNRITEPVYFSTNGGTYTFTETFPCNQDQIATFFPFSHQRMADYIEWISLSEWASLTFLGSSPQGKDIDVVTITNMEIAAENKDEIYIIGRQHTAETASSHMLEGIIDFLISDD